MVNIIKPKLTLLQSDILRILFKKAGSTLNQKQIADLTGVSQPAVMKALPYLEQLGFVILRKDKETKRWSIELNRSNQRVMQLKRVDNLKQIYESGLADFLEEKFPGSTIILFGSYSRGDDIINSDIDIAIIESKEKSLDLTDYEKILERRININFYDSFGEINKNLKENLANGIVLAGGFDL
jgi:predicted nucleotidyltransferase